MAFQARTEHLIQTVQALADSAPSDWRKLIFYFEFLEDEQLGLRNASTGIALGGANSDVRLDSYELGNSIQVFNLIKGLYLEAEKDGDKWTGVLFTVLWNGQFKCRFYYGQTPLLDADDEALDQLLDEGVNYLV